ncbi:MAG: tRNA (N6-threonylcarbamoyladenosine(37)-N6)-methyltransferase TrmO [Lachnospiraceae bacterium]|nr:tRNA (N6-threonylcarbamoyladenosine(37)-N6)-methyltransferase TrmO [Lachnospiraceae bacterium]
MRELKTIARIYTDFPEKFGIPRQSGIVKELTGRIEFEPPYRNPDAVRGIEGFDYLWLLWGFEVGVDNGFKATVRPPRLGGNERMGVFATRSPFRPNHIGLSSVRLERVDMTDKGAVLYVSGIDMRDNTPIYDIKPYLSYTDSHEGARSGFVKDEGSMALEVDFPEDMLAMLPPDKREAATAMLREDIRPSYQDDPEREYGVSFAGYDLKFRVDGRVLRVTGVKQMRD